MRDRLGVQSIMGVIFILQDELEEVGKLKARSAKAMCAHQDRWIQLKNAIEYLESIKTLDQAIAKAEGQGS